MRLSAHSSRIGRLGELLTMYNLERHGIDCALIDRQDADLWIKAPSGKIMTVQVKATLAPRDDRPPKLPRYKFHIERRTGADIFALVALDRGVVLIFPAKDVPRTIGQTKVSAELMEASIEEHILRA